jgi:hypothetical protein
MLVQMYSPNSVTLGLVSLQHAKHKWQVYVTQSNVYIIITIYRERKLLSALFSPIFPVFIVGDVTHRHG